MDHRTAEQPSDTDAHEPPDITTMRATTTRALTGQPEPGELLTLIEMLRGHIRVLIPEVATLAGRHPKDDIQRSVALACIGEAYRKLRIGDGGTPLVQASVAQKLGRCVNALCDHYVTLGGFDA